MSVKPLCILYTFYSARSSRETVFPMLCWSRLETMVSPLTTAMLHQHWETFYTGFENWGFF